MNFLPDFMHIPVTDISTTWILNSERFGNVNTHDSSWCIYATLVIISRHSYGHDFSEQIVMTPEVLEHKRKIMFALCFLYTCRDNGCTDTSMLEAYWAMMDFTSSYKRVKRSIPIRHKVVHKYKYLMELPQEVQKLWARFLNDPHTEGVEWSMIDRR